MADRSIRLGEASFAVAGGMESMSNAPHVQRDLRWGRRMGDAALVDVMLHDGLWCAFDQCTMGESSDRKNRISAIAREPSRTSGRRRATPAPPRHLIVGSASRTRSSRSRSPSERARAVVVTG